MPTLETVQATDPQYQDIWRNAIQEYEKNTKVALPANLDSIDDVLDLIKEQENQVSEFRNITQLRPMVNDVLNGVESFADVVGLGVSIVSRGILGIYQLADMSVVRYSHPQW